MEIQTVCLKLSWKHMKSPFLGIPSGDQTLAMGSPTLNGCFMPKSSKVIYQWFILHCTCDFLRVVWVWLWFRLISISITSPMVKQWHTSHLLDSCKWCKCGFSEVQQVLSRWFPSLLSGFRTGYCRLLHTEIRRWRAFTIGPCGTLFSDRWLSSDLYDDLQYIIV